MGAFAASIHSLNQQNRINDLETRLDALETPSSSVMPTDSQLSSICTTVMLDFYAQYKIIPTIGITVTNNIYVAIQIVLFI